MEPNTGIEVRQVGNGYIVEPLQSNISHARMADVKEIMVFQSFAELTAWLSRHFSHRSDSFARDRDTIKAEV